METSTGNPQDRLTESSLAVDAQTIRTYAGLTQDFNPIHLDPAFAATTPLGAVIAHGTLSLCLLWQSVEQTFGSSGLDAMSLDIRFVRPVYIGDVLTAGGVRSPDGGGRYDVWVKGQDGAERVTGTLVVEG